MYESVRDTASSPGSIHETPPVAPLSQEWDGLGICFFLILFGNIGTISSSLDAVLNFVFTLHFFCCCFLKTDFPHNHNTFTTQTLTNTTGFKCNLNKNVATKD